MDSFWVLHRGRVVQLPQCPDTVPYSTVTAHDRMRGVPRPGFQAVRVVSLAEAESSDWAGGRVLTGSGTREDPFFCPQMEDRELPECRCAENTAAVLTGVVPPQTHTAELVDGPGGEDDRAGG